MRSLETGSVQTLTAQIRTNPELICKFNLGTDGFIDSCNYTIDVVDYRKPDIVINDIILILINEDNNDIILILIILMKIIMMKCRQ